MRNIFSFFHTKVVGLHIAVVLLVTTTFGVVLYHSLKHHHLGHLSDILILSSQETAARVSREVVTWRHAAEDLGEQRAIVDELQRLRDAAADSEASFLSLFRLNRALYQTLEAYAFIQDITLHWSDNLEVISSGAKGSIRAENTSQRRQAAQHGSEGFWLSPMHLADVMLPDAKNRLAARLPTLLLASPVREFDRVYAVIVIRIDARQLHKLCLPPSLFSRAISGSACYLLDSEGVCLSQPQADDAPSVGHSLRTAGFPDTAVYDVVHHGDDDDGSRVTEYKGYRGDSVFGIWTRIRETGWSCIAEINRSDALAPLVEYARMTLLLGLTVGLVTTTLAFVISRRLVAPLPQLAEATRRFACGDHAVRIARPGNDEIGELASAFNRMAEKINCTVSTLEDQTGSLARTNKELEAFNYSVSHDLRAPLRSIGGFTELLRRKYDHSFDDDGRKYVGNIMKAVNQMELLIDDMLKLAQLGKHAFCLEAVPLADIMDDVISDLSGTIADTGATVTVASDLPVVRGNAVLLKQAFLNLVSNALTYHRPDEPPIVEMRWRREHTKSIPDDTGVIANETIDAPHTVDYDIAVDVVDSGIGIRPEYHTLIFEIFQRLHSDADFPGSGIGLAIVSKSIRLLGGEVRIQSSYGSGSTFSVMLQLDRNGDSGRATPVNIENGEHRR